MGLLWASYLLLKVKSWQADRLNQRWHSWCLSPQIMGHVGFNYPCVRNTCYPQWARQIQHVAEGSRLAETERGSGQTAADEHQDLLSHPYRHFCACHSSLALPDALRKLLSSHTHYTGPYVPLINQSLKLWSSTNRRAWWQVITQQGHQQPWVLAKDPYFFEKISLN